MQIEEGPQIPPPKISPPAMGELTQFFAKGKKRVFDPRRTPPPPPPPPPFPPPPPPPPPADPTWPPVELRVDPRNPRAGFRDPYQDWEYGKQEGTEFAELARTSPVAHDPSAVGGGWVMGGDPTIHVGFTGDAWADVNVWLHELGHKLWELKYPYQYDIPVLNDVFGGGNRMKDFERTANRLALSHARTADPQNPMTASSLPQPFGPSENDPFFDPYRYIMHGGGPKQGLMEFPGIGENFYYPESPGRTYEWGGAGELYAELVSLARGDRNALPPPLRRFYAPEMGAIGRLPDPFVEYTPDVWWW